jgi:serine-type D-Ala-D-Ala carboxypeptidase/endopeptidase (penicillin-binding protein 4)
LGKVLDKKVILDTTTGDSFPWQKLITEQDPLLYKGLLHDSDNGIAEALLLMIAHEKVGVFRPEVAIDSLKELWKYWLPDPLEWVDGSGVSRYNMFTPRTLVAVLQQLKQKLSWEVLSAYMPQGGATGTLKAYPDLVNVYAKTGTLRHNHNLSGYWVNAKGKHYAFSILVNHFTTPTAEVRQGISELLLWMQRKAK